MFIPLVFRCVPMCRWHLILFYCLILFMNDSVANWFIHIVCCWDSFVLKLIHEGKSLRLHEAIIPNSKDGRLNGMTTIFYRDGSQSLRKRWSSSEKLLQRCFSFDISLIKVHTREAKVVVYRYYRSNDPVLWQSASQCTHRLECPYPFQAQIIPSTQYRLLQLEWHIHSQA